MGSATTVPLPVGRLAGVGLIIFFANAAMLVLQLVAGRLLAPFIGSSLETWTSIIGVFLLGIALGNAFGGRLADRYPSPRTLALLLAVGATTAIWMVVFPQLLSSSGVYKSIPLGPRIPLLALALCLPAGFVLSLLTPLAIKLGLPDVAHTGRVAGMIFALSTLGCLLGNYLAGFVLIPAFTINTLVYVSAGVLLTLAAGALLLLKVNTNPSSDVSSEQESAPLRDATYEHSHPNQGSGTGWFSAILVTAVLLAVMFVTNIVADSWLPGSVIVLLTALWAAFDSAKLELHKYEGRWSGPFWVFIGLFLLWVILFPLYLVARSRAIAGELTIRKDRDPPITSLNPHAFSDIRLAYLVVFLASFGGMTLELTASRVLAQYLGVSLFTWTGIIGVMLAGTALGNFTGGQFADRATQAGGMRRPLAVLLAIVSAFGLLGIVFKGVPWLCDVMAVKHGLSDATILFLAVAVAVVGAVVVYLTVFRLVDQFVNPRTMLSVTLIAAGAGTVLLFVTQAILVRSRPFEELYPISQVMAWTFTLFFLPMFVLGMVSPQVIRLAVPDVAHVGRVAGRVYAWSTAGAIVGTFAAGYVLLSALGMNTTLLLVSLILTGTSLLVAKVWEDNTMLYLFSVVLGGITGGFILTSRGENDPGLVAKLETNYYTIKVTELYDRFNKPTSRRVLTLDALIHSEVDLDNPSFLHYEHEHIQVEFLWAAEAAAPKTRTLVIGGGGYTFPRYVMKNVPEAHMDVVEIDPGVTKVAKQHLGLLDYPNLNIVHMDGRQYVAEKAAPASYDLVVQDAVNDLSVPSHLLTKEYNDAVKVTLKPNGVYLLTVIDSIQWGRLWRSAVRTLKETFPHVELVSAQTVPREAPPAGATAEEQKQWKANYDHFWSNRQVLVIYASDRPLDEERVRAVAYQHLNTLPKAAVVGTALAASDAAFYTNVVPAHRLQPFLDKDPGILLTDQFAPVDNLMAEVFRYRYRARPEDDK